MRQRSATPLLQAPSLHPVLQAALGSLNVQLDEELARYRRQRRGYTGVAHRSSARPQARKQLDLIAVSAVGGRTRPQPASAPSPDLRSPVTPSVPRSQPTPPGVAKPTSQPAPAATPISAPQSSELVLADHWTEADDAMAPVLGAAALTPPNPNYDPFDYLESSEDLLRSLSEQEGEVVVQRSFWSGLATPLGVGSLMLLLASSALLGYVLTHPSSLTNLGFKPPGSPASDPNQPAPATSNPSPTAVLPNSPNLANKEFVDLNLNTLTTLKTNPQQVLPGPARLPVAGAGLPKIPVAPTPAPTTKPATATTPKPKATTNPPAAAPARRPANSVPTVAPLPPAPSSAPLPSVTIERAPAPRSSRPAPAAPRPAAAPARPAAPRPQPAPAAASPSNYYYVVTPYSGDRALEQARQSVPDAYVVNRPDGAYIRMGTMSNEAGAREMVEKLQQQGIPAQVQQR